MTGHVRRNAIAWVAVLLFALGGTTAFAASRVGGDDLKRIKLRGKTFNVPNESANVYTVQCKKKQRMLSGDYELVISPFVLTEGKVQVAGSSYLADAEGPFEYQVEVANDSGDDVSIDLVAVCLKK
ncbi:MAG: hypothetical protein ACR2N5_00395 [Solirubrobacterales bacterium]